MPNEVPFVEILDLLESHGWALARIDPPYRIFTKSEQLPIWIEVYERKVAAVDVPKIRRILEAAREEE